jgi:hypothetical protein
MTNTAQQTMMHRSVSVKQNIRRRTCRIEQAVRLWGVRPLLARLCRWGHRQWLRPVARYFLKGISCIHLTAIKPDAPSHNSTPYQVPC